MSISENFIRKPIMTVLVTVITVIWGIVCYLKLPISDLPVVDFPVITVSVNYPGASPSTMATAVAQPIENECTQIPGLNKMVSTNTEGSTSITLTFDIDRNIDLVAPDVQAAIQRASGNLPTDLPAPPTYSKTNPSDKPIMYICVASDTMTPGQLYDYGNKMVAQRLSMIEGVSQVQVWGAKTAVRIQVDPSKLASYQIGINDIQKALMTGTVLIPGGSIDGTSRAFNIEPKGQLFKAKDYEPLIVAYKDNAPVRLKDIAICVDSVENDVVNVIWGYGAGKEKPDTCVVAVSRTAGVNTVALADRLRNTIKTLNNELPGSVELGVIYDRSISIVDSINDVKTTIIIAFILVILVIFLFLGRITDTLIPSVTLPLSLVMTFIVMSFFKYSLDNLSLMGLTLAIGFVVDDAIVVLENSVRLIEQGKRPLTAAIESAKEISGTIVSMTLSLAVIFIPLVFMSGLVGRMFSEFAVTVIIAILCSGIVSLTLSPMMCARMLKEKSKGAKETALEKFINIYIGGMIKKYGVLLKWSLEHKKLMAAAWAVCFAGSIWFFMILPKSFLPLGDSGAIGGAMLGQLGISSEQMKAFQAKVNSILHDDPNVGQYITVTGLQPGADQSSGIFHTTLKEHSKREPMNKVAQGLRAKFSKLTEGLVFVQPMPALEIATGGASTASGCQYSYTLNGPDREDVYDGAFLIEQELRNTPGFLDIQNSVKLNMPQLDVEILRDRASTLGITAQDIEFALTLGFAGGKITTFKTDIDQYKVILELDKRFQRDPENLSKLYLRSINNTLVPLSSVVRWKEDVGPQNIPHLNQLNLGTISFNIAPNIPLGVATDKLNAIAARVLKPGVTGALEGEAQEFEESVASLGILILIAIGIKYVILGILYENYTHPFTILTTLPVATFGGLATLLIFGSELSMYAYIGIFMLLGIVAKNGIMMVDFANQNLEKGNMSSFDAIYNASIVRFRPILMTGLAAIMGAMPIALGFGADGSSRQPLGLIVVGGLIFSQVITLFITPAIFLYMQEFQEKYLDKFELTRSESYRKSHKEEEES